MRKIMKSGILFFFFFSILSISFANHVDLVGAQRVASNFWESVTGENSDVRWVDHSAEVEFQEFYILTLVKSISHTKDKRDDS